jgi:hypothetical protein
VISVTAEQNSTLRQLSLRYLDRFDSATIAATLDLNPAMRDPNRMQAGQLIRLPLYLRRGVARETAQADGSEREKPAALSEERP